MSTPVNQHVTSADLHPARRLMKNSGSQHDRLQREARVWVAQTFFGTLLKQMEQSPFKSELFSGGRGGEAFSSLYHQHLVERMARTPAGEKLVRSIVRKIEAKSAYEAQKTGRKPGRTP